MYRNTSCRLQAHRGVASDAPENTMAAFRLAVEQGYDIIEFDPKCTKDDVCVILHDRTLNRTGRIAGEKFGEEPVNIADKTFAELSDVDVGEWFDKKYCGEHIPTLAQTLDYMKSVDIEAKIDNVVQRFTESQIEMVFDIVEKHGNDKVGLTSTDLSLLERYAKRFPTAPLHFDGDVTEENLERLAGFAKGHRTYVWMRLESNKKTAWCKALPASKERVALVKQHGFLLGIWILRTDAEMEEALLFGADVVETTGGIKPGTAE